MLRFHAIGFRQYVLANSGAANSKPTPKVEQATSQVSGSLKRVIVLISFPECCERAVEDEPVATGFSGEQELEQQAAAARLAAPNKTGT
ncbi:hypothetical protein DTL42_19020 [Bremerella cremea]|uniref:Uncharacterized protein n=1 Tax=Bremerella cremea TaxID=1031537 RepID=A0A368KME5_9BACT|nr:hypothetical protein DTL42_19020 [Bremerella cremea]